MVNYFLKLDGIPGDAQAPGHAGEIELLSFDFSGTNPAPASGPAGGGGKVTLGTINVTKSTDSASVKLFLTLCKGTHLATGTVSAVKAGSSQPYLTIQLTEVAITSFALGAAGTPVENASLGYRTIQLTYSVQNPDGSMGNKIIGGWDVAKNAPL